MMLGVVIAGYTLDSWREQGTNTIDVVEKGVSANRVYVAIENSLFDRCNKSISMTRNSRRKNLDSVWLL